MISTHKLKCRIFIPHFLFAGMMLAVPIAMAQQGGAIPQPGDNLPPESSAVIERLESLHTLPDAAWKMHVGDVQHGEEVDLDDSLWQTAAVDSKAPNEAVWFRQTFQIPDTLNGYDLTGSRIWFQFHADANGPMPEILYFNGRRVALGEDLEPEILFDSTHSGDKVVVAVKLLHTVDTKTFRGATLAIEFPASRPNPVDLSQEFLSAAVLAPSLTPLPELGEMNSMATLNGAIAAVDLKALDAAEAPGAEARAQAQAKFDASLKAADEKLEALRPLLRQATFHLTGNAHIDAAWLWPWTETVDVVRRTFGTALQLMNEYPGYTYTQSAAAYNEWMAQKYP
jgi:alpha-mannosidase